MGVLTGRARREQVTPVRELLEKVLPDREEDLKKFHDLMRHWADVVGPAARRSSPCDLAGGTLYVVAGSPHAAQQIAQMKGNIQRVLKRRWGIEVERVQVFQGPPPVRPRRADGGPRRRHARVEPAEEEVRAFRERCPEALTPEAADALARLRAFFARRFGEADC